MSKRPKQHQLEDLSRSKYSLAIPRNWVMRDKDRDYGIDAEVEIFDEKDQATGLVYWVQLKATGNSDKLAALKLDLSIDKIEYYKALELPVLIVLYSDKEDLFYYKWAHEIDLFYAKENAKTIRIMFDDEDIWSEDSAFKIKLHIEKLRAIKAGAIALPVTTFLEIKDSSINGIPRGIIMSVYRQVLQGYSQFVIYQSKPEKANLIVTLSSDELVISLASITVCTFHSIKDRDKEDFTEGIVGDILLGLAISLTNIGQIELAAGILLDKKIKIRFFQRHDLLLHIIPSLIRSSRYGEVIDAVCEAIDANEDNFLENITVISALFVTNLDHNKRNKFQKLLNKCLAKSIASGENSFIGRSHYNLANHYRSRSLSRKSVYHYLMARRFESIYLNQPYYYQELGGSLFELGKYRFSARVYRLALDKGAPESVKPLYADALMFSGKYKLSLDVFSDYLCSYKDDHAEWHLKKMCLEVLIEKIGVEEQVRLKDEAINKIDTSKTGDHSFVIGLERAIELDNLCGLAWFNLGIERSRSGKHVEAAFCFVVCGLVQKEDIEAWVNATLCCLNKEICAHTLFLVIRTAYSFNREDYLTVQCW